MPSSYLPPLHRRRGLRYSSSNHLNGAFRVRLVLSLVGVAFAVLTWWMHGRDTILHSYDKDDSKEAVASSEQECPAPGSHETVVDNKFLKDMFTRVSTDPKFVHYSPKIMKPDDPTNQYFNNAPFVLVLDNFLPSHQETMAKLTSPKIQDNFYDSHVAQTGANQFYRKSASYNCIGTCLQEPWVSSMIRGMMDVTGLTMKNAEDITFTHYKTGGFYGKHHDYSLRTTNPRNWDNCGPRLLTFLVYLNHVEQGGATSFFHLGPLNVEPKPGRALIFPNVFPENPTEKDERTAHEALKVEKGEKYIAQTWFHPFDIQANKQNKCCD